MIKLHNLEKYFNRNRSNEIHVVNDITLELPKTGLVVLLGPSGSGKTTLLNVIGGLDKVHSGTIDFDGIEMKRYKGNQWDDIRNEHIGYIFQNYNLLNDQTVYDNIALTLRMTGIVDKDEIDKRINYILDNVGMINYRRRRAANLSGGQQQRVAIARALAKNPKVIIADEPTGNLDSKNTFDIMNILRNISHNKLVVLVTHEESIAKLYADRIIRLKDGEIISDESNRSVGGVDMQLETDIYLKDMKQVATHKDESTSFEVFSDEDIEAQFGVKLIVKNKTLYVQVETDKYQRVNLLQDDSEVSVINDHYKEQQIEEFANTEFDLETVIDDSKRIHKNSVISIKEAFRLAFGRFKKVSKGSALIYILFFLNAMIVGIALGLVFNAYHVVDSQYLSDPKNTVIANYEEFEYEDIAAYEDMSSVGYIQLFSNINISIDLPDIYQNSNSQLDFSYDGVHAEYFDESTLVYGKQITGQNQVIIPLEYAEQLTKQYNAQTLGITHPKDLLTLPVTYQLKAATGVVEVEVEIVGIADTGDVAFYAKEETLWMMVTGLGVYEVYEDQITFTEESTATADYAAYAFEDTVTTYNVGEFLPSTLNDIDTTLQAKYTKDNEDVPDYLYPLGVLKESRFNTVVGSQTNEKSISFYAVDPEKAVEDLDANALQVVHQYPALRSEYLANRLVQSLPKLLFAGIFLAASSIASYFILRSSLLSRIYEVSVYRALGAKKNDLRKIYLIEALILTAMTSLWGFVLINILLLRLQNMTNEFLSVIRVTPLSFGLGLLIIFTVNILSGIIPISTLLNRTPAEIISKYDF